MPINAKYLAPFTPESFFHVYNRTNNYELLFRSPHNKVHFLNLAEQRLSYLLDFYSWSLLPNHFHFQVKTKSIDCAFDHLSKIANSKLTLTEARFLKGERSFEELALRAWTALFQAYAEGFNNMYKRKGNLFYTSCKRVHITSEEHFRKSMVYIHTNPVKHGLIEDFRQYEWSSWKQYMSQGRTIIPKEETYKIFGNRQGFLMAHDVQQLFISEQDWWML